MYKIFNLNKVSSTPPEQAAIQFKQNVGWDSLSSQQQESIRTEVTRQVTEQIHARVKDLRQHVYDSMKVSGLDEKSELARILNYIRDLHLLIQGGRKS